jgi:hypothetical protein
MGEQQQQHHHHHHHHADTSSNAMCVLVSEGCLQLLCMVFCWLQLRAKRAAEQPSCREMYV